MPSCRVLLATLGSRGDVQPFVALGAALKACGHDVTVTTGQGFDAMIAARGLAAAPLSIDMRALIDTPEVRDAMRSLRGRLHAFRATKALMRRQSDELWQIGHDLRPEVIVYNPKAALAPYIARALGALAIPAFLQPAFAPTGEFPNAVLPIRGLGRTGNGLSHRIALALMRWGHAALMRDWRRHRPPGAPATISDPLAGHFPPGRARLRLQAYSRHLVPRPEDWPEEERVTGYWFSQPEPGWAPPAELVRFLEDGPPPVYVGFGSMPAEDAGRMTGLVIDALQRAGRRGLLAMGWGGLADVELPASIHMIDSAPHDWLFPRCAAIVHHGGAGTTHEALRWGRPSIVCPVFGDQPFWGRRVAALGAGPSPLPQKRLKAEALAAAIAATTDPRMADRAAELGRSIGEEGGAVGAAALIDALAGGRPAATALTA